MLKTTRKVVALAAAATVAVGLPLAQAATADAAAKGRVIAKTSLASRTAPSVFTGKVGSYKRNTIITVDCKLNGTNVDGNARWYKISGKNAWVSARYVENIGAAPGWCDDSRAGSFRADANVIIRSGPSTKDRNIGTMRKGTRANAAWVATRGGSVGGNTKWLAVETRNGNRGWVSAAYVR